MIIIDCISSCYNLIPCESSRNQRGNNVFLTSIWIHILCTVTNVLCNSIKYLYRWARDNSQMQCYNAITTIGGSSGISIITTCGVGLTIPCVTITCSNCLLGSNRLIDCQMQCYNTIATIGGSSGISIITTCGVGLTIPCVTITCSNCLLGSNRLIDCQMQCYNTIATICSCSGISIITTCSVCLAIP